MTKKTEEAGMSRREFLSPFRFQGLKGTRLTAADGTSITKRLAPIVGGVAVFVAGGVARDVAGDVAVNVAGNWIYDKALDLSETPSANMYAAHARLELLDHLFFSSAAPTDVVLSDSHRSLPPKHRLDSGDLTYTIDYHVVRAIKQIYDSSQVFEVKTKRWPPSPTNSLVCTGSANSNILVEKILGKTTKLDEGLPPTFVANVRGRRIPLEYTMAYLEKGKIWSLQCGEKVEGGESAIISRSGGQLLPEKTRDDEMKEDYLLVTRLPGLGPDTTITIFAGLHGSGTRGAEVLIRQIPPDDLIVLEKVLRRRGTPYFQAIFKARELQVLDGSAVPRDISLVRTPEPVALTVKD